MRRFLVNMIAAFFGVALLLPTNGNAQVFSLPNPVPQVTAAGASWQINGEPVFYAGDFYYPAGSTVYFDGNVMVRVGTYRSVPIYVDATLEPYSIVYVPVGGRLMRPYERRRSGDLAGTVGSRPPAFPIQRDVELSAATGGIGLITPELPNVTEPAEYVEAQRPAAAPAVAPSAPCIRIEVASSTPCVTATVAPPAATLPNVVQSFPAPTSNVGVWVPFDGAQWRSAGAAVSYNADRFVPIGEYHGFPVYREKDGSPDQIYIPSVQDGPLTPYKR